MDLPPLVRRVAWLQITFGLLCFGGAAVLFSTIAAAGGPAIEMLVPPLVMVSALVPLPALLGGVLLLHGNPWAPLVVSIAARFQMFVVPIGTVLGVWTSWAMWRSTAAGVVDPADDVDVGTASKRSSTWPVPRWEPALELLPEPRRTGPLLLCLCAVGLGLGGLLALGFLIAGDPFPADAADVVWPAVLVLSTTATVAFRVLRRNGPRRHQPN